MPSAQSTAEVVEAIRDAVAARGALRPVGSGTWLSAGFPVPDATWLDLRGLRGVVRYTPDDLTLTAEAGTTLAELDEVTRAHGQWCPLLPWGGDDVTIGATVATASTGPFAASLGRPRDLVLGLHAVDGLGRVLEVGGQVVKNVAGFDLTRTFTGAWGTLAVVTRVHLRLRARPSADESWLLDDAPGRPERLRALQRGPLSPLACERIVPADATAVPGARTGWLVRIGGNTAFVSAARAALSAIGEITSIEPEVWTRLRRIRGERTAVDPTAAWRWDALSRRLKETFDPQRVLNPGLLGDTA